MRSKLIKSDKAFLLICPSKIRSQVRFIVISLNATFFLNHLFSFTPLHYLPKWSRNNSCLSVFGFILCLYKISSPNNSLISWKQFPLPFRCDLWIAVRTLCKYFLDSKRNSNSWYLTRHRDKTFPFFPNRDLASFKPNWSTKLFVLEWTLKIVDTIWNQFFGVEFQSFCSWIWISCQELNEWFHRLFHLNLGLMDVAS